jgi:nicotinamide riboside kinase
MGMNKIGFTGTQSTGKSTLVKSLAGLPEFEDHRCFTERSKYLRDLGIPLNTDSTYLGQLLFLSERASELLQEKILTDRTIIDVIAFANSSKSMNDSEKRVFRAAAFKLIDMYDFIFYISPEGVDIENNGVRETNSEYRDLIDKEIKNLYEIWVPQNKQIILSGTNEQRIEIVLKTIFP